MWVTEHHFLEEYSHLSDSATFIAYALAKTERIHIGSGIFNMNPMVNHPVRLAERVAMLDLLSQGRFEFGTGRGAGSHEIGGFGLNPDQTRENWEEAIREVPKMWRQKGYSHPDGKAFKVPTEGTQMMPGREGAFNVLPKPYSHTHPALWVAAGIQDVRAGGEARPGTTRVQRRDRCGPCNPTSRRTRSTSATPSPSATTSTTTSWSPRR